MMAKREKKPIHKVEMTESKRQIIQQLLQEYDIETATAEDIQDVCGKIILPHTHKTLVCLDTVIAKCSRVVKRRKDAHALIWQLATNLLSGKDHRLPLPSYII